MTVDEHTVIDQLPLEELRRFAHHQQHLIDRLLRERETHLAQVEAAFRRRHNDQLTRIRDLEQQIKDLKAQRKGAA